MIVMHPLVVIVAFIIHGCIYGAFCKWLALQKNHDPQTWYWLGFFFSFVALITLGFSPSRKGDDKGSVESGKTCPSCAESIKPEAYRCRYCGHEFSEEAVREATERHEKAMRLQREAARAQAYTEEGAELALVASAQANDKEAVAQFLDDGVAIEQMDADGRTAVIWAVLHNNTELLQFLLDQGANVDHADLQGLTPLMIAAENRSIEIVRILLTAGADPKAAAMDGKTALHFAVKGGRESVVEELLKTGVNPRKRDGFNRTPLDLAAREDAVAVLTTLLEQCDPASEHRVEVDQALRVAAEHYQPDAVKLLLDHHARPTMMLVDRFLLFIESLWNSKAREIRTLLRQARDRDTRPNGEAQ